ncbi:winged helix-turn-helix domain-containing protein [Mesobacillus zeae]|uniref:LysR family transcriptional regulator n=1 Tax=Mesobacillus zeae TaxID=1917180 RepID=A0A398B4E4_9BACI|nr:LysR family transcriptional regulator [Mesobacillus zeae]RID82830.1 LysR family transcriptional regulator [Mesobacillus zeae]
MSHKNSLNVKSKIWIELKDEVVFGLGRIRLFEEIEKTGSMSQAAASLEMSYRAAWGKVTATEERLQLQLVKRQQGNRKKGTILTPVGKELLHQYSIFQKEAQNSVDELFEKHLGELLIHLNQHNDSERCID